MKVELVPYDETWPKRFLDMADRLQAAMGGFAGRVEHIGSTSVPGLAAKPIIDIQVSAPTPEGVLAHEPALRDIGFEYLADNDDRRKLYFRRRVPGGDMNLHVRPVGSFSEQAALLFRDYLRASADARARYEAVKRELALREWDRIDDYADAKGDCIWQLLREADRWSWNQHFA